MSGQASLDGLPNELIVRILEFATGNERPLEPQFSDAVTTFYRTNRRLHELSRPFMYQQFSSECADPLSLLRAIACSPQLARFVRCVEFKYGGWREQEIEIAHATVGEEERKLLTNKVRDLGTPFAVNLSFILQNIDIIHEKYFAALLMFAPNIEHLGVADEHQFACQPSWLETIRFGAPHSFQHLKSVKIRLGKLSLGLISPLLLLPSMRSLELLELDDRFLENFPLYPFHPYVPLDLYGIHHLPPGTSKIDSLHLRESDADSKVIKLLLNVFDKLKSFEHDFCPSRYGPMQGASVPMQHMTRATLNYADIAAGLARHAPTLEHLRLCDTQQYAEHGSDHLSLQSYEHVKTLYVTYTALFDHRASLQPSELLAMPPNVEEIEINFNAWYIREHTVHFGESLKVLAQYGKVYMKNLRKVKICGPSEFHIEGKATWEAIAFEKAFEDGDIDFEFDNEGIEFGNPLYYQPVSS